MPAFYRLTFFIVCFKLTSIYPFRISRKKRPLSAQKYFSPEVLLLSSFSVHKSWSKKPCSESCHSIYRNYKNFDLTRLTILQRLAMFPVRVCNSEYLEYLIACIYSY
uniref:Cytoplasmic dynein light chain n=1 Tax=Pseudodiaptomus poplesia TaxID=213370 RepID=A0A1S6GL71_9MAXI|nr:cytoplasmic dynein light chain [Pseudodiaptomus poplesia]